MHPVSISPEKKRRLNICLLMFFTGFTRFSAEIQSANSVEDTTEKKKYLGEMYQLVNAAENVLTDKHNDLDEFGRLLDCSWKLKKQTGKKVSTDTIDRLYEKGMRAGALGGKLLGAGGGGFLLFYVRPEAQERVKASMSNLLHIPFAFENSGTRVLYYAPEEYHMLDTGRMGDQK